LSTKDWRLLLLLLLLLLMLYVLNFKEEILFLSSYHQIGRHALL